MHEPMMRFLDLCDPVRDLGNRVNRIQISQQHRRILDFQHYRRKDEGNVRPSTNMFKAFMLCDCILKSQMGHNYGICMEPR